MARMLYDWLASFQELPIEGVGSLRWHRQPAMASAKTGLIQAPVWTLRFQEDPSMQLPDDFFLRLAAFGQRSVADQQKQYQDWMQLFNTAAPSVELWGFGTLSKDQHGKWTADLNQVPLASDASLDRLPMLGKKSIGQWRWSERLVLLLFLVGLGWLGWTAKQSGFRWGVGMLKSSWKTQPVSTPASSYQEIR